MEVMKEATDLMKINRELAEILRVSNEKIESLITFGKYQAEVINKVHSNNEELYRQYFEREPEIEKPKPFSFSRALYDD